MTDNNNSVDNNDNNDNNYTSIDITKLLDIVSGLDKTVNSVITKIVELEKSLVRCCAI